MGCTQGRDVVVVHPPLHPLGCSASSGIPVRLWPSRNELDDEASLTMPGTKEAKEEELIKPRTPGP